MNARAGASIAAVPAKASWDLQQVQGQRSRLLEALASVDPRRQSTGSSKNADDLHSSSLASLQGSSGSASRFNGSVELGSGLGMFRRPLDRPTVPEDHESGRQVHAQTAESQMRDMLRGSGRPDIQSMRVRDPHRTGASQYAGEAAAAKAKGEAYLTMFGTQQQQSTPMRGNQSDGRHGTGTSSNSNSDRQQLNGNPASGYWGPAGHHDATSSQVTPQR